jgi:VanZ family protein
MKPDKIVHLLMFGTLSFLLLRAFQNENAPATFRIHTVAWAIVLTISYGALTEVLQTAIFIKRHGDVRDAIANSLGAVLGWYIFSKRRNTGN